MVDHVVEFDRYTDPMKRLFEDFVANSNSGVPGLSAHPRIVNGKPSANPPLLPEAPRPPPRPARIVINRNRRAPGTWNPCQPPRAFSGERRASWLDGRNNPPDLKSRPATPLEGRVRPHSAIKSCPNSSWNLSPGLTGKSPSTIGFGSVRRLLTDGPFNAALARSRSSTTRW